MGLYVYGVIRAQTVLPVGLHGVGDPPSAVRVFLAGPVAAVVGDAPADLRARRRDMQAHQNVLLEIATDAPVLPARFGVVAPDEDTVRSRLEAQAGGYLAVLDRVEGRVEMNLKIEVVEGGLADLMREDEKVRRVREESLRRPGYDANIRLGQAVVAGLRRRAASVNADAMPRLADLADEVAQGPDVAGCVANVSYLIEAGQVERMRLLVGQIAAEAGSRATVRLTGPLPCYSFCALPAGLAV